MTIIQVMEPPRSYQIVYANAVRDHLRTIEPKYHTLIRETIEQQLLFDPDSATRNRKPLRPPGVRNAEWELRFGPDNRFRVFYVLDSEKCEVQVLAIGVKKGNRLYIGGEEVGP